MKLVLLTLCLLAAVPCGDSVLFGNTFSAQGANVCQFCDYCKFVSLCGPPCNAAFCHLCKFQHHCTTTCKSCQKASSDTPIATPSASLSDPSTTPSPIDTTSSSPSDPVPSSRDPVPSPPSGDPAPSPSAGDPAPSPPSGDQTRSPSSRNSAMPAFDFSKFDTSQWGTLLGVIKKVLL